MGSAGLLSRDEVTVPDLRDKTLLEAEELLSENSLKIKVEDEVYDAEIEKTILSVSCQKLKQR